MAANLTKQSSSKMKIPAITLFSAATVILTAQAQAARVFPGQGYGKDAYSSLSQVGSSGVCIAHGDGAAAMLKDAQTEPCNAFVFLASVPSKVKDAKLPEGVPCLVVGGDLVSCTISPT